MESVAEVRALIEQERIPGLTYRAHIRRCVGHAIATLIEGYDTIMAKYSCPRRDIEEIASVYAGAPIDRRDVEDAIDFWSDTTLVRIELISKGTQWTEGAQPRANCYRWVGVTQYAYKNDGVCPIETPATGIAGRIADQTLSQRSPDSHRSLMSPVGYGEQRPSPPRNAAEWLADQWFTPQAWQVPDWVCQELDLDPSTLTARMYRIRQSGGDVTVEAVQMSPNGRLRSRMYVPDPDEAVVDSTESRPRLRGFSLPTAW